ncbi:CotH kinase family protein [Clostridium cylindrosporum]|uniref:Spore coat protein CotH n=1 Tax=Clostridium cylindrosporum DSM 605 TaxID=1121307 RepID=A0A0J8G3T7_CLOCY|nr:CotH kinase family protein [Clostridium cylindrosporum]KMT22376.1 spore coat protein CotH [Clostridium cylindrosporum DSM 605]
MISSKHFKIIVALALIIGVTFTTFIMFIPRSSEDSKVTSFEYETKVFNKDNITSINIEMDTKEWDKMLKNATKEEYTSCDVTINGTTFKNVGIRPKGNSSLSQVAGSRSNRYSFKIEFDHYVEGQTCFGLDKLVINNIQSDATYMKEYLSYDIMNYIGITTPLYSFTNVSVNGKAWGLYLAVESLEESFAKRSYGTYHGMLYKPETMNVGKMQGNMPMNKAVNGQTQGAPPMDMNTPIANGGSVPQVKETNEKVSEVKKNESNNTQKVADSANRQAPDVGGMSKGGPGMGSGGGSDLKYIDESISSYSNIFDYSVFDSTKSDKKRVIKAIKSLNSGENLESYLDVDGVLRYIAANTILVNLDSYFSSMKHNYYLYEKDGKISILPWDYNLSFAGFQGGDSTSAVNFPIDTPVSGVELSERPLVSKLLSNSSYKEKYHDYLQKIVSEYFTNGVFENKVNKLNNLIKNYVKSDPTAFYKYEDYQKAIPALIEFGKLRSKSVQGQLDGNLPSSTESQRKNKDNLIKSSLDMNLLGSQGMGKGPNMGGKQVENSKDANEKSNNQALDKEVKGKNANIQGNEMKNMPPFNNQNTGLIDKSQVIITVVSGVALILALVYVVRFKRKR